MERAKEALLALKHDEINGATVPRVSQGQ